MCGTAGLAMSPVLPCAANFSGAIRSSRLEHQSTESVDSSRGFGRVKSQYRGVNRDNCGIQSRDINMRKILFYRVSEGYGEFSNFSPHPIELKGKVWPTNEHYFQAQKFADTEHEEAIRLAKSPMV